MQQPVAPLSALVEILRDDAARAALIRDLEAAAAGAALGFAPAAGPDGVVAAAAGQAEDGTPSAASAAAGETPQEAANDQTLASRTVQFTREVAIGAIEDLQLFWLRLQRVPRTLEQAQRGLSEEVVTAVLASLGSILLHVYGVLILMRLLVRPLRRRLDRQGLDVRWINRLALRIVASIGDIVLIPLASFLGVLILYFWTEGGPALTPTQTTFLNAFFAVEAARVVARFILSPKATHLRFVMLSDAAALSLWRVTMVLVYLLGYGQVLFVPIVETQTSVFVARSVASVLGAITVLTAIVYVLMKRRPVGEWLGSTRDRTGVKAGIAWLASRWHWPVLAYLIYLLAIVLTRPGNVLLPLLLKTALVILAIVVGLAARSAIAHSLSRRVKVPPLLSDTLPLLEERLNHMVPALLMLLRAAIFVAVMAAILNIIGLVDLGAFLGSSFGSGALSRLIGVCIVLVTTALIWLALSSWVEFRLNPFVGNAPTPREITLLTLMRNALTIALVIVGLMFTLSELGVNIGPLLASAGVLGLAISWGSQKMVEDIITGIFIQFENAMNVGDVVDVGGTVGTVEKLTVRSVTLRDLSGIVHMIPFSSASKISNYMRDFSYHIADMGVAYRENIEDVRAAMFDAFEELRSTETFGRFILGDLEWFGLNSFGDSALVIRARIKTRPGQQWGVGRAYNGVLKRIFDERGIEIPFPHQTVYFGEDKHGKAPALHLQLERARRQAEARAETEQTVAAPVALSDTQSQDAVDADGDGESDQPSSARP